MIPIHKIAGRLGNSMFQFAFIYNLYRQQIIPDIYLQNETFFKDSSEDIRKIFGTDIIPSDYVSVHVRRGDYVDNPFYVDLTATDYYKKAMGFFPDSKFLIFSDDIDWCKKQKIFKGCDFSEGLDEVADMNRMAGCKHNIIANSSFSWWAAWLNPSKDKTVLAPLAWFKDTVERVGIPETWKRI